MVSDEKFLLVTADARPDAFEVVLEFRHGVDRLSARLADGRWLDAEGIARLVSVPDLTLAGSALDLELAAVDWPAVMRRGYFGTGGRWER